MAAIFETIHPDPVKQGVRIDKVKYDLVRSAIIERLQMHGSMTFQQLGWALEDDLGGRLDGSVMWYYTTIKLDLEARGEIRRVPNSKPQLIELA